MESSPFGKLSAELRNEIYELALTFEDTLIVTETSASNGLYCSVAHPTALLQTSRQIRSEATKMFYANNSFHITDSDTSHEKEVTRSFSILQRFFNTIGLHNSNAIKHLSLDLVYHQQNARHTHPAAMEKVIDQIDWMCDTAKFRNFESFECVLKINYSFRDRYRPVVVELDVLDFEKSRQKGIARQENKLLCSEVVEQADAFFAIEFLELLDGNLDESDDACMGDER
ncbi:hypothetical protein HII31_03479 [Pseudocercospora fuligena]|uniref:Uncharacterized protein n=1 Tax=Pseudocercospora fuligena TaxID=685502 RepID=A0A8H6RQ46_9PEZI|nr:hypothetical protein HII31_03479 [Pseudocercospora fuligena]